MVTRQTRFSDVCGTMDEFKRMHVEEYECILDDPPAAVTTLLEDARYMLLRMQQRIGEYDDYRARVASALQRLDEESSTDTEPAERALAFLDDLSRSQGDYAATGVPEIAELAEAIRSVASSLEHELRSRMELALELNRLFLEIKRDRPWVLDDGDTGSYKLQVEAKYQSWLPSEPHRTLLLDRLASATAEIIDDGQPGAEPMVQFDDGGSMAMSQVRYDATVQNFHPANHKPAPGGRLYRRAMPATVGSSR